MDEEEHDNEDQDSNVEFSDSDVERERSIQHSNNHPINDVTNNLEEVNTLSSISPDNLDDTVLHLNIMRERLLTEAGKHVKQKSDMREYCNSLVLISKQHKQENIAWNDRVITEVADYAQNLDVPHFGSEQPGDTYYFSPLSVYLFGIVRLYNEIEDLVAFYYFEGDGKKGGNNVASLIYNKFLFDGFVDKINEVGPMKEYNLIMDNCGGQNKNRMVIRLFMMLAELGYVKTARMSFLVRGHTKNPCDRNFMLLKKNFHWKNIYTKQQLDNVLNSNDNVQAIRVTHDQFFDFDAFFDTIYKRPAAGTVNRSHIFTMFHDRPGILEHKDSSDSAACTQNLRKGIWSDDERKKMIKEFLQEMEPMTPPGIRQIKKNELYTKWRPLIPEQYQDDLCPKPELSEEQQTHVQTNEAEVFCLPVTEEEINKVNENVHVDTNVTELTNRNENENENSNVTANTTANLTTNATTNETANETANANANVRETIIGNTNENVSASANANTRRSRATRKCGYCKQVGHDRRSCPIICYKK